MHPGTATTYAQHNGHSGYYAPTQQASYGPVYYPVSHATDIGQHVAYDNRKRGYDALNDFFGDAKRRQIDPNSYAQVGQRLMALQGVPMHGGSIADYLPAPAMVSVGHGHAAHMPQHQYALPPMPNLRTKNDLLNIDQFLEQMQSTVYESPNAAAAAGVQQPGAHYTHQAINFRHSQSPPQTAVHNLMGSVSSGMTAPMMAATSSQSTTSGTPALTPPSSTLSYTSGASPASSLPSVHGLSPVTRHNSAVYPSLPSVTQGYSPHSHTAPSATLGTNFDSDQRRRYSGGMLQRSAAPRVTDDMDISEDAVSPSSSSKAPTPRAESTDGDRIDPTLSTVSSPGSYSESGDTAKDKAEEAWVENIRVIEALRKFISDRLERGEYESDDVDMEGTDEAKKAKSSPSPAKNEEESLYPVLRAAIDSDN
jgi:hypothetical protein